MYESTRIYRTGHDGDGLEKCMVQTVKDPWYIIKKSGLVNGELEINKWNLD